jgi:nicotinamidase-related amidase
MAKSTVFGASYNSLEFEIVPSSTALVIVDMQYLDAHRDYGTGARVKANGLAHKFEYFFSQVEGTVVPNIQRLLHRCRAAGIEVVHLKIASLVSDCRDVSLEHRRLNLLAPSGSKESEILEELKPLENEIVISKGASGAFNSTAIDQILRNLRVDTLIITGVDTNYCVETAVRDAADRGYNVVLVSDGCTGMTAEYQRLALEILSGIYCVTMTAAEVLREIE